MNRRKSKKIQFVKEKKDKKLKTQELKRERILEIVCGKAEILNEEPVSIRRSISTDSFS